MKKLSSLLLGLVFLLPFATPALAANTYTSQQVGVHNVAADCWTIVNNKVYNVTSYLTLHPGGQVAINSLCGIDGSSLFNGKHASNVNANNALANYYVGDLLIIDTTTPSVPTNLSAAAIYPNQINLTWTKSSDNVGVTGYKVYINNSQVGTSTINSYISTGLASSTSYIFNVSAFDANGNVSATSSSVTATTTAVSSAITLNTPTGLRADLKDHKKIKLTWDAPINHASVKGYRVLRDGIVVGTSRNRNFMDSSIVAGTTYSYTVVAFNAAGSTSPASNSVSITTKDKKIHADKRNNENENKNDKEHDNKMGKGNSGHNDKD
ncbi:MAG: cytochrome b5 domain-containing protein [Candidatus Falkowbacteria bacterium]